MIFRSLWLYVKYYLNGQWHLLYLTAYCIPLRSRKLMTMNFYQMSSPMGKHEMQKKIGISHLVCKSRVSNVKRRSNSLFSGNTTSGYANFTKFRMSISIDVRNKPWKFQIDMSKIGYFTEQSVKWRQMLVCKIQNGL